MKKTNDIEELKREGNKALALNIAFFITLLLGIIALPFLGGTWATVIILASFVLSILFICFV